MVFARNCLWIWLIASACFLAGCENKELLGFSKGKSPISYNVETEALRSPSGVLYADAKSCEECHKDQYRNWVSSRHRAAFTNELYQESHQREHLTWCVNCHAPLMKPRGNPEAMSDRIQPGDGISCNVCHVREGRLVASRTPVPEPGKPLHHSYSISPQMAGARMCESCHQFNFPDARTMRAPEKGIAYSDLVMQNTVLEWQSSGFSSAPCQQCHLLSGTADTHSFPGGHDLKRIAQAVDVRFRRVAPGRAVLEVYSTGIGHAFPTGDLFRTLKVRVYAQGVQIFEAALRKDYANLSPEEVRPERAMKRLVSDTTLSPPGRGEFSSMRLFPFDLDRRITTVEYEIRMDYLHGFNHLVTGLPLSKTQPLVESGFAEVSQVPEEPGNHG